MSVLLATTRASDLQPLGTAGQSVASAWPVLQSVLLQRLGPAHAALLAEPMVNAAQGETDWYTRAGPAVPLPSLPAEAAAAVRATLTRLGSEIGTLAQALAGGALADGAVAGDRVLGALLQAAVQVPDEAYVFVAGDQPVLVAWGHSRAGAAAHAVVLTGVAGGASRRPMAILPPPPAPDPPRRRFGPALAAALLLSLLMLGGAAFLLGRDPLGWYSATPATCAVPPGDMALRTDLDAAGAREGELRLRLAQLTTDAGARRLRCAPVPAAQPVPVPVPRPLGQDQQRAQNRGGATGKLTIILAWDDRNDLDLSVRCPGGGLIWYKERRACGGVLDVDANENTNTADVQPVENMFFAQPAPGEYRVIVDPYAMRVSTETPFRVTIQQEGQPDRVLTGVARNGMARQEVVTVTVAAGP